MSDSPQRQFIDLLQRFHTAMLITLTPEHAVHARPMAFARVEEDGTVWFFSGRSSAKVREIELNSHVSLTAQDGDSLFLTIAGRAVLLGDREKVEELWREPFRVWFPAGRDDPNLQLIAVRPEHGEFWDNTGANRLNYYWEAAKAYVSGTTPEVSSDQHATVAL